MLIVDMQMPKSCCDCMAELMGLCVIQDKDVPLKNENGDYPTDLPKGCPIKGELVTCGECKHYKDGMCYNPNTYDDEKTCGNTTADWFCADGKRKE